MSAVQRLFSIVGLILISSVVWSVEHSGVVVNTSGRANVRYGPTTQARVITTLPANSEVLVIGPVEGREGWYAVAFPRQGHAWAHESILQATDDPNWFKVTREGANVRSDSRINAELVTQLALDELVEFKGRKVGNWLAIHPIGAKAYMYKSVLKLGSDVANALQENALRNDVNERRWQVAKLRYEYYRGIFSNDNNKALSLDWIGLDEELDIIIDEHPTIRTQLLSKRLKENIAKVVRAAASYQQSHSIRPLVDPEFTLPQSILVRVQPTPTPTPQPQNPVSETPQQPTDSNTQNPTPSQETVAAISDTQLVQVEDTTAAPVATGVQQQMIGWIEQRDDPGVGSTIALLNNNGDVIGFVKAAPGSSFDLADFFWREVTVMGQGEPATVTISGTTTEIVVITATNVRLAQ